MGDPRLGFTPPDSPSAHEDISQNTLSWFPCIPLEHNYCCDVPKNTKVSFWQLRVCQSQRHKERRLGATDSVQLWIPSPLIRVFMSALGRLKYTHGWDVASQGRRGGSELVSEMLITARAGCLWDRDMQEACHLLNGDQQGVYSMDL